MIISACPKPPDLKDFIVGEMYRFEFIEDQHGELDVPRTRPGPTPSERVAIYGNDVRIPRQKIAKTLLDQLQVNFSKFGIKFSKNKVVESTKQIPHQIVGSGTECGNLVYDVPDPKERRYVDVWWFDEKRQIDVIVRINFGYIDAVEHVTSELESFTTKRVEVEFTPPGHKTPVKQNLALMEMGSVEFEISKPK
jgi:hypothetical protein